LKFEIKTAGDIFSATAAQNTKRENSDTQKVPQKT